MENYVGFQALIVFFLFKFESSADLIKVELIPYFPNLFPTRDELYPCMFQHEIFTVCKEGGCLGIAYGIAFLWLLCGLVVGGGWSCDEGVYGCNVVSPVPGQLSPVVILIW